MPLKLWILSDLHLDTVPYPEAFEPTRPDFDVLVAAGDVWEGDAGRALKTVARLAAGRPAVFVMGNHEYWNGHLDEELADARRLAREYGVTLLEGEATGIEGTRFVGATLWADGRLAGLERTPEALTGEQIDIAHEGGSHLITVGDAIEQHRAALAQLEALLALAWDGPTVVVTHHAPHPLCLAMEYRQRWMAGIAASDLSHLTDRGLVDLWVHGHLHQSVDLVRPGGTRIVCNPAGDLFSNARFQDDFVVEVRPVRGPLPDRGCSRSTRQEP